ncbi:putative zinc-binding oxidoreductase ToxD-2 [Coleophoma crateriformis]|uniref:Putative zinc-binding oxidoreductase ToxD-2 n=1 Tax=Coleophoma crateriformis TaxID=565419 RepID=A0A3D8SAM6_9HELO|nr:putative zinc-binding oxidoreductase ToxD-2 [Coleophoma crateriformis]
MASSQNRGLVKVAKGQAVVTDIPVPSLQDDYLLVRTIAVALNPADWQNLDEDFVSEVKPMLNGHDAAGIIEAVGKNVTSRLKKGDRIMCAGYGVNVTDPEDGVFAEHIRVRGDISIRIPSHMSMTDAATMPVGLLTVALGLYKYLGLPFPPATAPSSTWLFVYGGSSATGTLAIQFAKLSGLKVVTTCSPRNFDLVKSLGADAVYDYRDPDCAAKIRSLISDDLTLVFDTIATTATAKVSAEAMSSGKGGIYCNLMGVDAPRDDVKSIFYLGYSAMGRPYMFEGEEWPFAPGDYDLAKRFAVVVEGLLEQRLIKPHPVTVRPGGLEAIPAGMQDLKDGKISGEKLVYVIGEE